MTDFATFAVSELSRLGISYRVLRNDLGIICPQHRSQKLNCYIHVGNKAKIGSVNCFVCGYSGHWNSVLVRDLCVPAWDEEKLDSDSHLSMVAAGIRNIMNETEYTLPVGLEPWSGTWRFLDAEFLRYHDANLYYDPKKHKHWILFVVKDGSNRPIGHVQCRLDQNIKKGSLCPWAWMNDWGTAIISCPKYDGDTQGTIPCKFCSNSCCTIEVKAVTEPKTVNSSGSLSLRTVYPLKDVVDTAVLCEGIYSALRFRKLGIPAHANLGVKTWSQYKASLLHGLGVRKVVLCFDGDEPGYTHARTIRQEIKNEFDVTLVDLPPGYDPGNIQAEKLGPLYELLDGKQVPYLRL